MTGCTRHWLIFQNWLSIITGAGRALDMGAYTGADVLVVIRMFLCYVTVIRAHRFPPAARKHDLISNITGAALIADGATRGARARPKNVPPSSSINVHKCLSQFAMYVRLVVYRIEVGPQGPTITAVRAVTAACLHQLQLLNSARCGVSCNLSR